MSAIQPHPLDAATALAGPSTRRSAPAARVTATGPSSGRSAACRPRPRCARRSNDPTATATRSPSTSARRSRAASSRCTRARRGPIARASTGSSNSGKSRATRSCSRRASSPPCGATAGASSVARAGAAAVRVDGRGRQRAIAAVGRAIRPSLRRGRSEDDGGDARSAEQSALGALDPRRRAANARCRVAARAQRCLLRPRLPGDRPHSAFRDGVDDDPLPCQRRRARRSRQRPLAAVTDSHVLHRSYCDQSVELFGRGGQLLATSTQIAYFKV